MTSSVSSSASDWPPKITNPIAWLVPEPMPLETMSGIMPATKASVVIRIGRSRSRLACTMASCVDSPFSFSWFAWSICRIEFFFTTPNNTSRPSAEKMFSDCWNTMIDSSAKGSVSGSDSRIVIGCSHDSNCAARIRYMKTSDSTKASTKFWAVRPSSLDRPANTPR